MSRFLLITIINFIFSFFIGLVLVFPLYQDFKAVQLQIENKEREFQLKQEYFSEIEKISKKLKTYPEELIKIDYALPNELFLPFLYDFFQGISSQNGLILQSITSSYNPSTSNINSDNSDKIGESQESKTEKSWSNIKEVKINISLSGSYTAFKNFLYSLEKSARLIEVENISFSFITEQEQDSVILFNVSLKTHIYQ